jgi:hypothetical protein
MSSSSAPINKNIIFYIKYYLCFLSGSNCLFERYFIKDADRYQVGSSFSIIELLNRKIDFIVINSELYEVDFFAVK